MKLKTHFNLKWQSNCVHFVFVGIEKITNIYLIIIWWSNKCRDFFNSYKLIYILLSYFLPLFGCYCFYLTSSHCSSTFHEVIIQNQILYLIINFSVRLFLFHFQCKEREFEMNKYVQLIAIKSEVNEFIISYL